VIVRSHVNLEVARLIKSFVTDGTKVTSLIGMNSYVSAQETAFFKREIAHRTKEHQHLFGAVLLHMFVSLTRMGERLATLVTVNGTFAGV